MKIEELNLLKLFFKKKEKGEEDSLLMLAIDPSY
jgi:hypothetical protein